MANYQGRQILRKAQHMEATAPFYCQHRLPGEITASLTGRSTPSRIHSRGRYSYPYHWFSRAVFQFMCKSGSTVAHQGLPKLAVFES